ncbi:MAG: hypothetical protein A4E54_01421 [Pelotomaculum sp. PtaB.Bin117]|nr:MAG: hypothetical protein A4E54_01421 [Pelotomaculum sp. PtaB.Bin117]OPY61391.1 MAG: hypothetical protein A4E56_02068 [Pelotomaculum sp. PtaU1.Bin065]
MILKKYSLLLKVFAGLMWVRGGSLLIHYARAFDYRGLEVGRLLKFSNDTEGFGQFTTWVGAIKEKNIKDKVMVGMEPTGHYWFNLAQGENGAQHRHHAKFFHSSFSSLSVLLVDFGPSWPEVKGAPFCSRSAFKMAGRSVSGIFIPRTASTISMFSSSVFCFSSSRSRA